MKRNKYYSIQMYFGVMGIAAMLGMYFELLPKAGLSLILYLSVWLSFLAITIYNFMIEYGAWK